MSELGFNLEQVITEKREALDEVSHPDHGELSAELEFVRTYIVIEYGDGESFQPSAKVREAIIEMDHVKDVVLKGLANLRVVAEFSSIEQAAQNIEGLKKRIIETIEKNSKR